MLKSIKKTYKYFIIAAAVTILLPTVLFLILRTSVVQTFLVNKVTAYISNEIKATVSVGKVEFSFFNKLAINDILIKDQNNDTLLYALKVTAGIKQIDRRKGIIKLGRVVVMKPVVAINTDSTGQMNLTWYLDMLQKPKDTTNTKSSQFYINQIEVSDARFSLQNKIGTPSKMPLDLNNLKLNGINAIIENLRVENHSTTLDIYNLGFHEGNGFVVKKMNSSLLLYKQNIVFRDVSLLCDSSIINADHISILADSAASFKRFINEVKLDLSLRKSLINSSDLEYFLPFIHNFNESVWLSGDITGTVSELKGRNIVISYKDETYLDCNFDFSGLPDIANTFIFVDVSDLRSISRDIEQLKVPGKGSIMLPEVLRKLGVVSFSGSFTGFTTDFVTYGKINTNKGIISTDLSMRPEGAKRFRIKGLMKGSNIDLGSITGNEKLFGNLTIAANVEGYTDSFKTFTVNLAGKIDSVEINSYKYRNIELNGNFANKAWDGNIKIEDENIHMDMLGMLDFRRELPEFDFTLNLQKADLYKLHIDKADTSSALTLLLTANFKGNNIDNLDGEIKMLNSNFRKYSTNLEMNDFGIRTFTENNVPAISLRTDFIDANLNGRYNFEGLNNAVKSTLASLMPSKYNKLKVTASSGGNDFIFDIKFKNTDKLNAFLRSGILLAENSDIRGSFFPDSIISITGKTKIFAVNNNIFKDLSLNATIIDSIVDVNLKSSSFNLSGLSDLKDLSLNLAANPDHFNVSLDWDNKDKIVNKGSFKAQGVFSGKSEGTGKTLLRIDLLPGEVYSRNNLWKINPAEIRIDSNSIYIGRFNISNNENYFLIDGTVSENSQDTLHMKFNGINISPLNNLYEKKMKNDPNMIRLSLGGILHGNINLTDVYRNFMFESDIRIDNFTLLESQYGEVRIESVWNNSEKVAELTANNDFNGKSMFDVTGFYDPGTKKANLVAKADKLPIDILNPLLKVFASGITGTASGTVNLTGELSKPELAGALWGENATMKVDYLQSKYRFSDSIRFDKTSIKFNNIQMFDEKGNTAFLNGAVYHKYFKNFAVDLTIKTNDCMVLNTKPKDNDLFYGTAYASGVTTIKTIGPLLSFDISAKTGQNTRFFIPLNTGLSVSENKFVSFVNVIKDKKKDDSDVKIPATPATSTAIEIAFDLEVTPDAEVQMIMDPKVGDVMKGTGRGNLNVSLDRKRVFRIYGDYTIESGDYLFTLGNIINKSFSVENGGKISFNGDVENADLDIKAIYRTKASLYDIIPDIPKQKERIPVECQLLLSGKLFNPVVGFDIYLPTADEETRAYLKSMIKSDEDMSRQFLFLLVMNSFYADPMAGITTQSTANIGSTTVGVTTMEMFSNQLSNWLSQISKDFDIGVVYRPGSTALPNSQELQVALSTQLLNDKVVINGNFDVGGNQATTGGTGAPSGNNSITGAFDVEYKINEKIRFKVFNRSNDNFYIDNGILYTQGIGLFYRQDFNKLRDLFKKSDKSLLKPQDSTKIKKQ
jgi:hypothetical protein